MSTNDDLANCAPDEGAGMKVPIVLLLAGATLLVFGGLGAWAIVWLQERSLSAVVFGTQALWQQGFAGLGAGALISVGAWAIITRPFLSPVKQKYAVFIGPLMPSLAAQVVVSLCAGVGEELFFRGALQHWLGIPWTAFLFVALHGYLDPRDFRISIYGVFLTLAMVALGWLAREMGLFAPMIAHTLIDIYLLNRLVASWRSLRT